MPLLHHDPGFCGQRDRAVFNLREQWMHVIRLQGTGYRLQQTNRSIGLSEKQKHTTRYEKPIFMSLRGPKALDDKGHEGKPRERQIQKPPQISVSPRLRGENFVFW